MMEMKEKNQDIKNMHIQNLKKIIFLDRDGTIIEDHNYIKDLDQVHFIPGAMEALKKLQKSFLLVIVTNQSGIGRGYYTIEDFHKVNGYMMRQLERQGINIQTTLFCDHSPEANCECRKPGIKLVNDFLRKNKFSIDKKNSWMIGDKKRDIKFGENLGIKTILLKTGKAGQENEDFKVSPSFVAASLADVPDIIAGAYD